jgi:lysophospholipase L1-like esterase
MRDPRNTARLEPEVDSGDHLHPNEVGYRVMAEAVDLSLFTR